MPPYFSGTGPPRSPSGAIFARMSFGKVSLRSRSRAPGAISLSAKSFASLRTESCSGVRSKSTVTSLLTRKETARGSVPRDDRLIRSEGLAARSLAVPTVLARRLVAVLARLGVVGIYFRGVRGLDRRSQLRDGGIQVIHDRLHVLDRLSDDILGLRNEVVRLHGRVRRRGRGCRHGLVLIVFIRVVLVRILLVGFGLWFDLFRLGLVLISISLVLVSVRAGLAQIGEILDLSVRRAPDVLKLPP